MRFQVPQFTDVEDKIIGPFTLKQFLIYVAAAMILVPVYLFSDLSLFITLALPVAGVAAAFAHLKLNGKSLFAIIAHALGFYTAPQLFLWRRTEKLQALTITDPEWIDISLEGEQDSALTTRSRDIETGGSLVQSEEIPDDLVPNDSAES